MRLKQFLKQQQKILKTHEMPNLSYCLKMYIRKIHLHGKVIFEIRFHRVKVQLNQLYFLNKYQRDKPLAQQ